MEDSLRSDMLLSLGCNWLLVSPRVVASYPLPPRSVDPLTKEKPFQVWPATAAPGRANYQFLIKP